MKIDLRDRWILACGRRGCGKTTLSQYLIKKSKHHFKEIFCVSPSAFSGAWDGVIPSENVQHNWSEEWLMKLIERMIAKNKGKNQKSEGFLRVLVVLDDCLSSEAKAHNSKALKILASRGRHCGISVYCNLHFLTGASPMMRNCADYIVFGVNNQASIELLHEEFGVGDMNVKEFAAFVRKNTQQFRFLVVDNTAANTDNPDEVYATIKAPSS
jgi:energy-coupling factor transporter ATP-binding protein EcfA2